MLIFLYIDSKPADLFIFRALRSEKIIIPVSDRICNREKVYAENI